MDALERDDVDGGEGPGKMWELTAHVLGSPSPERPSVSYFGIARPSFVIAA